MGNISYLANFGRVKFHTTALVFVRATLRYDTYSRLLINPHEKQQVDVRKVINHSANMAANWPAAFPLFFSFFSLSLSSYVCEEELLADTHSEQMHKMLCVCVPRIFGQHIICLTYFVVKFSATVVHGPLA